MVDDQNDIVKRTTGIGACMCCEGSWAFGYVEGAAVMAGIIGMFEAIRSRFPLCSACNTCLRPREKGWWVCDDCGTWRQPYYNRAKGTWA